LLVETPSPGNAKLSTKTPGTLCLAAFMQTHVNYVETPSQGGESGSEPR
jgi:hypothetical protein